MSAITTTSLRISFPHVFKPKSIKGKVPRYSITCMFDKAKKDEMDCLKALYDEAQRVQAEEWPDPATRPRIPLIGHDLSPIKDGDKNCNNQGVPLKEKYPEYEGHYVLRASRTEENGPVVIVDSNHQDLLKSSTIYGGCRCKVNMNPYAYSHTERKGITFGLNGVMFIADGDSFGRTRLSKEEMFGTWDAEDPRNYPDDDPFKSAHSREPDPFKSAHPQEPPDPFTEPVVGDDVPF